MLRKLLPLVLLLATCLAQKKDKDPVSVAPPKTDLLLTELPAVQDPDIAFRLRTQISDWVADEPLKLAGPVDAFLLSERLYDSDPIKEPEKSLAAVFGPQAKAEVVLPLRRATTSKVLRFWGFVDPIPLERDKLYLVSGAIAPDLLVLAFRCIRGRNHITTASSRIEVIDFASGQATALVGNWVGMERFVGTPAPTTDQMMDDVRVVVTSLSAEGAPLAAEAVYVRHYFAHAYLLPRKDNDKNLAREESLATFLVDTGDGTKAYESWAAAKASLPKTLEKAFADYASFLAGRGRMRLAFSAGRAPREWLEGLKERSPDGGLVQKQQLTKEGPFLGLSWVRHSTNHVPTLGATDPRTDYRALRKLCAAFAAKPTEPPALPWWQPNTSSAEAGDIVVQLGKGVVWKGAQLRTLVGWMDVGSVGGWETASAEQLQVGDRPEGTVAEGLLQRLITVSAESVPGAWPGITAAPFGQAKKKK